ncbi:MAG: pyridoxamine 5-phosphate oxidase [Candidatus Raymondbacteria bacterium RifOxyA12_full_50_37]|uniref:Pyridoxamine 5-phosphate oxidase n=1 Tax=Candidatus Raymondbacteria bacterium RIFOXYD12_FULL_49_13 TaxID=1817890 RepID=A0A1F7F2F1_UNCRA|nr:MAG: pyridoxamine 5-phosphate oxidase [Candidatus Raymondbacteria bacterium RifOxyA12_full_50_37]OGJ87819.1 MAG: pyridoxamine 5-phosphate oxidase [Candidatus Raymondbacteria bacterium RifOxyB12_full_50_8]OGJ88673.1 MAG: pyridoxamine 5-phosphate oxidase [Candidatus Raymondbacteria bacterium RIFOXYA2_FULL_49_16]OGJ95971.1 MAG: pyridoxamine 5-phosphate oxidase [Candidatus Raymondbacteria bacterium RifOxyC12_full_50_8]OGK00845.1 MAG: pyridoxamine 5-phosphate oxidase [Candidatus Raymondbacteria b
MRKLPDVVTQAWENREGPVVFTTVDTNGMPNAIYATCVKLIGGDKFVIADNYFSKTRKNILSKSKGAVLFIDKIGTSYQIKGPIEYDMKGEAFADMKTWLDPKFPGHAAAAVCASEVYSGSERLA